MNEDEKKVSALGFRPCSIRNMSPVARFLAERRSRQEQSKADLTQDAETERLERFTQELAQELMNTYPPEKIADIAARQMVGVDYFRLRAVKSVDEYRKREASNRMAGLIDLAEQSAFIADEIRRHALELWENDSDQELRVTDVAGLVRDAVDRDHPGRVPGIERIKGLVRPHAPDYARRGGAPKGKRKRSKP